MVSKSKLDILESSIRRRGDLLDVLLLDRSTRNNIIWATDSYENKGKDFYPKKRIKPELVTGEYVRLIQPRAAKSLVEQKRRTKDKAEVFTPKRLVEKMNIEIDWASKNWPTTLNNWQDYVKELKLEITCGEAPFIVTRYNPTSHTGKLTPIYKKDGSLNRAGFLDRKLHVVSQYCLTEYEWLDWAKEACKASYGYEWQGDNLLIARENILHSFADYYENKFGHKLTNDKKKEFAEIISWNIWQMDGLKYVIPMSCKHETKTIPGELTLFGETPDRVEKDECEGCKYNLPKKHNGKYAKIMDWENNKIVRFVDLLEK